MENKKRMLIIGAIVIIVVVLIVVIATLPHMADTIHSFKQGFDDGLREGRHEIPHK